MLIVTRLSIPVNANTTCQLVTGEVESLSTPFYCDVAVGCWHCLHAPESPAPDATSLEPGGVSFSYLKSMLGLGHVNLWPEELERKRMGKSSRWTLIWSLLQLFLVDWKLLLADWASALSPHSSLIGHSCGTSLFARKWTCRCCLWVVVCTLG